MLTLHYKTKKELKESVGQHLKFTETAVFGQEFSNYCVVTGTNHPKRSWFAEITIAAGRILAVR